MKFLASADRRQELMLDMGSLVSKAGTDELRRVYLDFCSRKGVEPQLNSSEIQGAIADHMLRMKKHYHGQFRQSLCVAIAGASQ